MSTPADDERGGEARHHGRARARAGRRRELRALIVSHGRPRSGCRSAPRGRGRRGRGRSACCRPSLGRWKVTVTSARTLGSDGSPELRSSAVGVSTARTGTPSWRARRHSSTACGDGVAQGPADAGAEQAVDDQRRALEAVEQQGDVVAVRPHACARRSADAVKPIPVRRGVGRARSLCGAHQHDDVRMPALGQTTRGDEGVAAVVARAGEDEQLADDGRSVELSSARAAAATAVPACSISSRPGTPMRCARRSAPRISSAVIGRRAP